MSELNHFPESKISHKQRLSRQQVAEAQRNVPLMWFEPQNPSQLTVIAKVSNGSISAVSLSADHGVGAPGTGCVEEESTALIQIVTAHERHFREGGPASSNMKDLSLQYRASVRDCLSAWRRRIYDSSLHSLSEQEDDQQEENTKKEELIQEEKINLTLLSRVYIIIHVSEIFLPMLSPRFREDGDPFNKPGYVTADTVRFLRCHLVEPAEECVGDDASVLEEMVNSEYPEQFQGGGSLYWRLLEKLVLRGCLVRAWNLVKAHSLYRAVMVAYDHNADTFLDERQVCEIANAFRVLQVLLLCAPLPAGRTEDLDDALTTQELIMMEDTDDEMDYEGDFGVTASDYKLWDVLDFTSSVAGDYPLLFSAEPADRAFRKWKEQVAYLGRTCCLLRRIPEFERVFDILLGDFKNIIFDSWSEELCAELLYLTPTIRPRSVSRRASALMQKFGSTDVTNDTILAIMEGEAGRAIEHMYINGGCSGAALPSTLVSLYCSLFMEYEIVEVTPESLDSKIDRLKESAAAIVSSLVGSPLDIGVQNAVRLLIPYAERGESPELVATIACILCHYSPSSDQAARLMISYCRPLVEQKSMQMLEGCTDVLLYLYREHSNDCDMYVGAMILLDGIELESFVFPQLELGACYRALASKCHASSLHILLSMVEALRGNNMILDPSVPDAALSMKRAFDKHAMDVGKIPEARQLVCVLDIFTSLLAEKYDGTGSHIVECLDTRIDASTGVVCYSSSLSLHALLLQVAHSLVKMEARESSDAEPSAIFDKKGMTLCLTTLNRLQVLDTSISNHELAEMTKSFMEALARAFEVENAKKSAVQISGTWNQTKVVKLSANLHQYDLATQERIVAEMLDF